LRETVSTPKSSVLGEYNVPRTPTQEQFLTITIIITEGREGVAKIGVEARSSGREKEKRVSATPPLSNERGRNKIEGATSERTASEKLTSGKARTRAFR
jgi:hypothetical protein